MGFFVHLAHRITWSRNDKEKKTHVYGGAGETNKDTDEIETIANLQEGRRSPSANFYFS